MPTTQTGVEDWIANYSDEPERVREFCVRHGILDEVRVTIDLARRNFPPIEKLTLSLWKDHLEGAEKARVVVELRCGVGEALAGYRRFNAEWGEAVPFPQGDRIAFSYYIV